MVVEIVCCGDGGGLELLGDEGERERVRERKRVREEVRPLFIRALLLISQQYGTP